MVTAHRICGVVFIKKFSTILRSIILCTPLAARHSRRRYSGVTPCSLFAPRLNLRRGRFLNTSRFYFFNSSITKPCWYCVSGGISEQWKQIFVNSNTINAPTHDDRCVGRRRRGYGMSAVPTATSPQLDTPLSSSAVAVFRTRSIGVHITRR